MLPRAPTPARSAGSDQMIAIGLGGVVFGLFALELLRGFSVRKLGVPILLAAYFPLLALHELGHALAAVLVGARLCRVVIGVGRPWLQLQVGGVPVTVRVIPAGGYVSAAPRTVEGARWRMAVVYAGGPGLELLFLLFLVATVGAERLLAPSQEIGIIALQSVAAALVLGIAFNLFPWLTHDGHPTDGLGILTSPLASDAAVERWVTAGAIAEIEPLLRTRRVSDAMARIEPDLERHPENVWLVLLLASLWREADEPRRAGQLVEPWLERDLPVEQGAAVHAAVAAAARDLGQQDLLETAAEHAAMALEAFPLDPSLHVLQASIALERGQAQMAVAQLEAARERLGSSLGTADADHRARDECDAWLALAWSRRGHHREARQIVTQLRERGAQGRLLDRVVAEITAEPGGLADVSSSP